MVGWGERQRDRLLAVLALVFATGYTQAARGIEDSLLADAVGAGGVPQGVGIGIGVAALALFAKSFVGAKADAAGGDGAATDTTGVALRTIGLVLLLVAYGALLPWLGYPLTLSLLVLAAGRLAGAPWRAPLLACAAVAGPALWALFDLALQVRMPVGSLWS